MWEMLQRSETERLAREPSPKGARALVWLRRHHKMTRAGAAERVLSPTPAMGVILLYIQPSALASFAFV
ncbi:hypothetical protein HU200_006626 [Digitaria exilis]|uniref:Uncharacterized protein n=1 Tax=Digitaria exilis TaxID=1010633 RepID=A0A835KRG7_9POAL|nr:hypothetical protein HU200_006626 [Digitaria exilis]